MKSKCIIFELSNWGSPRKVKKYIVEILQLATWFPAALKFSSGSQEYRPDLLFLSCVIGIASREFIFR